MCEIRSTIKRTLTCTISTLLDKSNRFLLRPLLSTLYYCGCPCNQVELIMCLYGLKHLHTNRTSAQWMFGPLCPSSDDAEYIGNLCAMCSTETITAPTELVPQMTFHE
eukprot:898593-Amphidinium_carterae.1